MSFHRSTYDRAPRMARQSIAKQSRRMARLASFAFNAGDTESSAILASVALQSRAIANRESI